MKAIDFVTEVRDANHKPSVIEERCINTYISCIKKMDSGRKIVGQAFFDKDKNGASYYSPNRALLDVLTDIEIIRNYTDIEIDAIEDYDLLCSEQLIESLKAQIPQRELNSFIRVVQQCAEDVREKEGSVPSVIRNLLFSDKFVEALRDNGSSVPAKSKKE